MENNDDCTSEISDQSRFITRGAFLLTPSHDLSLDKAANICDKLNFRGGFSVTKTATGILFKFSDPDDFQQVFRKGFHKVTGGRLYRKVNIPCRPQKTFSLLVHEIPGDLPEEDVRASLYRYGSVVEVTRIAPKVGDVTTTAGTIANPPIRVTVASLDDYNQLLDQGLDFYGATYFPTEPLSLSGKKDCHYWRGAAANGGGSITKELAPSYHHGGVVFDSTGFSRIPPPTSRLLRK